MKIDCSFSASPFKARCLEPRNSMEATGTPLTITQRGHLVARLVPMPSECGLFGAMRGTLRAEQDIVAAVGDDWKMAE